MPDFLQAQDPTIVLPRKGVRVAQRPLPPPGHLYDGTKNQTGTLHYRAKAQATALDLGGSTVTDDVTTMTIRPTRTAQGSAWADDLPDLVVSFKTLVGGQTITAVAAGLVAAVTAAVTIDSLADISNYARWSDFVTVEVDGVDDTIINITALNPGAKFTVSLSSTGSVTSTQSSENATDSDLIVGTFAVIDGHDLQAVPYGGAPTSSSTSSQIAGVVMDGPNTRPVDIGYNHKSYESGKDAEIGEWGRFTVYAEGATTIGGAVYARKTATGTEIAGAASATAILDTPEVYTLTPTPADSTLYGFEIEIYDYFTGAKVAQGDVQFTSGVGTNATLISNGLRTSLADDNDQLDNYVTGSGTDTVILTMASPYIAKIYPYAPGVLAGYDTPSTAADSDHMIVTGAKFIETTSGSGIAAVDLPHP